MASLLTKLAVARWRLPQNLDKILARTGAAPATHGEALVAARSALGLAPELPGVARMSSRLNWRPHSTAPGSPVTQSMLSGHEPSRLFRGQPFSKDPYGAGAFDFAHGTPHLYLAAIRHGQPVGADRLIGLYRNTARGSRPYFPHKGIQNQWPSRTFGQAHQEWRGAVQAGSAGREGTELWSRIYETPLARTDAPFLRYLLHRQGSVPGTSLVASVPKTRPWESMLSNLHRPTPHGQRVLGMLDQARQLRRVSPGMDIDRAMVEITRQAKEGLPGRLQALVQNWVRS